MKSTRFGTFETNSSSCHSITIMGKSDWEAFKNHQVYINSNMYDMEEHVDRYNIINAENHDEYIKSMDSLYNDIKDVLDSKDECFARVCRDRVYGYSYDAKDEAVWNYTKKNFDKEFMLRILTEKDDVVVTTLEKPIEVNYRYNGEDHIHTYDSLTIGDFSNFIFGYGYLSDEIPHFYIYGRNGDWDDEDTKVEEYIKVGEEDKDHTMIITRDEEC